MSIKCGPLDGWGDDEPGWITRRPLQVGRGAAEAPGPRGAGEEPGEGAGGPPGAAGPAVRPEPEAALVRHLDPGPALRGARCQGGDPELGRRAAAAPSAQQVGQRTRD